MVLHIQERRSPWLGVLLVGSILALLLFGGIFAAFRDWLSGLLVLLALVGVLRAGWVWRRVSRRSAPDTPPHLVHTPSHSTEERLSSSTPAFVGRARLMVGVRSREGFIVVGEHAAAFVPTFPWRHLAVEILVALFSVRVKLNRFELTAEDSPALVDELAALVELNDGVWLDGSWVWMRGGKVLLRSGQNESLTLIDPLPEPRVGRWTDSPQVSSAQLKRTLTWIAAIAAATVAMLTGAGITAWRLTGEMDYLVAGLSFAGMVTVAVVVGLVIGLKQVRAEAARRESSSQD